MALAADYNICVFYLYNVERPGGANVIYLHNFAYKEIWIISAGGNTLILITITAIPIAIGMWYFFLLMPLLYSLNIMIKNEADAAQPKNYIPRVDMPVIVIFLIKCTQRIGNAESRAFSCKRNHLFLQRGTRMTGCLLSISVAQMVRFWI
jgi:hypothetical protein